MLTISGQRMQFILQDDSFKGSHFKFLGRWLCPDLDEAATKTRFLHKFHELLETVDKAPLDGFMKLWLYQHFLLGMLSWPLLIQDFNHDFVKTQVTRPCGVYLRRWADCLKASMQVAFTAARSDLDSASLHSRPTSRNSK